MWILKSLSPLHAHIRLDKQKFVVGRDIVQVDHVLEHDGISRMHAILWIQTEDDENATLVLKDCSQNGILINGQKLLNNMQYPLQENYTVTFLTDNAAINFAYRVSIENNLSPILSATSDDVKSERILPLNEQLLYTHQPRMQKKATRIALRFSQSTRNEPLVDRAFALMRQKFEQTRGVALATVAGRHVRGWWQQVRQAREYYPFVLALLLHGAMTVSNWNELQDWKKSADVETLCHTTECAFNSAKMSLKRFSFAFDSVHFDRIDINIASRQTRFRQIACQPSGHMIMLQTFRGWNNHTLLLFTIDNIQLLGNIPKLFELQCKDHPVDYLAVALRTPTGVIDFWMWLMRDTDAIALKKQLQQQSDILNETKHSQNQTQTRLKRKITDLASIAEEEEPTQKKSRADDEHHETIPDTIPDSIDRSSLTISITKSLPQQPTHSHPQTEEEDIEPTHEKKLQETDQPKIRPTSEKQPTIEEQSRNTGPGPRSKSETQFDFSFAEQSERVATSASLEPSARTNISTIVNSTKESAGGEASNPLVFEERNQSVSSPTRITSSPSRIISSPSRISNRIFYPNGPQSPRTPEVRSPDRVRQRRGSTGKKTMMKKLFVDKPADSAYDFIPSFPNTNEDTQILEWNQNTPIG